MDGMMGVGEKIKKRSKGSRTDGEEMMEGGRGSCWYSNGKMEILSAWASLERMRRRRRSSMPPGTPPPSFFFFRSPGLVWSGRSVILFCLLPVRLPEPLAVWKWAGRAVLHKALDGAGSHRPGARAAGCPGWLVGWLSCAALLL
jgi:hypothetical protein